MLGVEELGKTVLLEGKVPNSSLRVRLSQGIKRARLRLLNIQRPYTRFSSGTRKIVERSNLRYHEVAFIWTESSFANPLRASDRLRFPLGLLCKRGLLI